MSRKRLHYRKIVHCGACVLRRVLYILFKHYTTYILGSRLPITVIIIIPCSSICSTSRNPMTKNKKKVFCNYHYLKKKTIIKKKKIQTRVWISVISNLFEAWAIITGVTLCMKCFSICGFDIVVIKLFSYFSYKFLNHIY